MQKGSLVRRARHSQSEVWEFRWREPGPTGTRRHRRIVVCPADEITDESAARKAVAALRIEISPDLQEGDTKEIAFVGNGFVPICAHEIRANIRMNTVFRSLRDASCGAFLCPSVPTPNPGDCRKYQILFGVPDGDLNPCYRRESIGQH